MMQLFFISLLLILSLYGILLLIPALVFAFSEKKSGSDYRPRTFISVLLPVRNEEKSLASCLESLSKLNYPEGKFEIIVIDDHSTDATKSIVQKFSKKFPRIKIINNLQDSIGKKSALTLGVNSARGELIVTTDGDCTIPVNWLLKMAEVYEKDNPVFIAGPVAYKKQVGIFRDLLQIEQLVLQLVSGGAMKMGFPMMCSGANLAYRKDFFLSSGGYEKDEFASGDDMFLMLKAQKKFPGKLKFLFDPDSIVRTDPAENMTEAIGQRSRWLSKFSAYRTSWITGTGIVVFLCNFLALFSVLISLWKPAFFVDVFWVLGGKMLIDVLLLSLAVPFYREPRLLLLAPIGEIFYPFLAIISALARFSGSFSWKGRKWKT